MGKIIQVSDENLRNLGFVEEESNLYTNGRFYLQYSGYGIAILYQGGDDQPIMGISNLGELEFALENYDDLVC